MCGTYVVRHMRYCICVWGGFMPVCFICGMWSLWCIQYIVVCFVFGENIPIILNRKGKEKDG